MKRNIIAAIALLLASVSLAAQTPAPAPVTSTLNFSIGANALGLGLASKSAPASDITLSLNPGFSGSITRSLELRSDNVLSPGSSFQYYGGGVNYNIPLHFSAASVLSPLSLYVDVTVGVGREVPSTGASRGHVGYMGGGGLRWTTSSGVKVNLVELNNIHTPGAPWGNNAPALSSGLSYVFGHQ